MKLNRKLATAAIALTATVGALAMTATGASALTGYEDGFETSSSGTVLDVGVNYIGTNSIRVQAVATDATGDAYCTTVKADVRDADGRRIGAVQTLGSVCYGRTASLPLKSISTTATAIDSVHVWSEKGNTGTLSNWGALCFRGSDYHVGLYVDRELDVCH